MWLAGGTRHLPGSRLAAVVAISVLAVLSPAPAGAERTCEIDSRGGWRTIAVPHLAGPIQAHAVDPYAPRRLFVADKGRVVRSLDGGCTWEQILALSEGPEAGFLFDDEHADVVDVIVPTSRLAPWNRRVYVVIENASGFGPPSVLVSNDNGDNGSWQRADSGLSLAGRPVELTLADSAPNVAYLSIELPDTGLDILYRSKDGGATWSLPASVVNDEGHLSISDPINNVVAGAPDTFEEMVVDPLVSTELWVINTAGELHHSIDGGISWYQMADVGEPVQTFDVFHEPGRSARILAFADSAVYRSVDGGASWIREAGPPGVQWVAHGMRPQELLASSDAGQAGDRPPRVFMFDAAAGRWRIVHRPDEPLADLSADRSSPPAFNAHSSDSLWFYEVPTAFNVTPTSTATEPAAGSAVARDCVQDVAPGAEPSIEPNPPGTGPIFASNFAGGGLFHFDPYGNGSLVATSETASEGIELDPLGRVVIATRYSDTIQRFDPVTGSLEVVDPALTNAEGPSFDADGTMYIVNNADNDLYSYRWPQSLLTIKEKVWDFARSEFLEDTRIAPPGSPYAGDLFVMYNSAGQGLDGDAIARFTRTDQGWDRQDDFLQVPLDRSGNELGVLGMAFAPEGSLYLSGARDARIWRVDPWGADFEIFVDLHKRIAAHFPKIDVAPTGYVFVSCFPQDRGRYPGDSVCDDTCKSSVMRFDPSGRRLYPDFTHEMLRAAVGVAAIDITVPPLPPPPGDPPLSRPPFDIVRAAPFAEVPPAPPAPPLNPVTVPGPVHAPVQAPVPQMQPAPAQAQAANAQAVSVVQRQEQPQMAFVHAVQQMKEQLGAQNAMVRTIQHRSDPLAATKFGLAMSALSVMLIYGFASATVRRAFVRDR